jgi:hypothetical protein
MKHMAWGAGQRLFNSLPPVAAYNQIQRNFQIASKALDQARDGEWALAGSTVLEIPEQTALGAARSLTGPIDAALSIPGSVQTAINADADPEMRGAAIAEGAVAVATVAAAVVGAVKAAGDGGPKVHSKYADGTPVLEGQQPARLPTGPDSAAEGPHTRLRWDHVNNRVYQGREFSNGGPVRDIDFTSPTYPSGKIRPDHIAPPHQHSWIVNDPKVGPKSGFRRGSGGPLE